MNKNTTTTRLTDAQIHQLKYPKAVLVETDIFEKENLTEADYLALIDPEEINTIKKALRRTAYLSEALQEAEENRMCLMNFDLRAQPTIEGVFVCFCNYLLGSEFIRFPQRINPIGFFFGKLVISFFSLFKCQRHTPFSLSFVYSISL
jgi:hypothetical protein